MIVVQIQLYILIKFLTVNGNLLKKANLFDNFHYHFLIIFRYYFYFQSLNYCKYIFVIDSTHTQHHFKVCILVYSRLTQNHAPAFIIQAYIIEFMYSYLYIKQTSSLEVKHSSKLNSIENKQVKINESNKKLYLL